MEMRNEIDKIKKLSNRLNEDVFNQQNTNIGNFILQALNLGFYSNFEFNSDSSSYDRKLIFTFNVGKIVKIEEIDQRGIFLTIDGVRENVDSKILVAIVNKLKELTNK